MHTTEVHEQPEIELSDVAARLRAVGLAARTADDYTKHLRYFMRHLNAEGPPTTIRAVTETQVRAYILTDREWHASTRRLALHALRTVYREFFELTDEQNPAKRVKAPKPVPPRTDAYSEAQAARILSVAADRHDLRGRFDYAILAMLRFSGVRAGELVAMQIQDVDLEIGCLQVVGKGQVQRLIPIPPTLVATLREYLNEARPLLPPSDQLFANPQSLRQGEHHGATTTRALADATRRYGRLAQVPGRHHPHKWRHTFATSLARSGQNLHVIQRLLGHANIATTVRYLHADDAILRAAVDSTFSP